MKTRLRRFFSGILIAAFIASVAVNQAVFATPPQTGSEHPGDAKHEPKRGINPETGKISFIGAGEPIDVPGFSHVSGLSSQDRALGMAQVYGKEFGLKNPSQELRLLKANKKENGNDIVRYQQIYQDVPVIAGEMIVNINPQGELLSLSGEVSSDLKLDTKPTIQAQEARKTALAEIANIYGIGEAQLTASVPETWIFDESLLTASTRPVELVWRIEVAAKDMQHSIREMVLVNAQTGEISFHINQVDSGKEEISERLQTGGPTIQYADLIVDEGRGKLYGADKAGSKIDVINMSDLSVTDSYLLVSGALPTGIDLSPDGNELAVAQSGLSRVKFINLNDGSMSDTSSVLTGSSTKPSDVLYGRQGSLYALSSSGLHVIDTTVFPHAESSAQFVPHNSSSYSEGFGAISSDQNTLFYVTGTCCSGYNSLYKYDISAGLTKPVLMNRTYLSGSGYKRDIRLSLINDDTLITSFGTVYNTETLVPIAKNGQSMFPVIAIPGQDFYVTHYYTTSGQDALNFFDNQHSYRISSLNAVGSGTPGALAVTEDGATLFASSTGGMMKVSIGTTPPGTPIPLPASLKQYRDLEFDMPRNVVYGTDASNRIDVIDQNTGNVVDSYLLPNGANPIGIDLRPDGNELAIALNGLEKILFINPETGETITEVTPQVTKDIYYINRPYDVIYGRAGRLYSDGNPGSGGIDGIHVFDSATHTWLAQSGWSVRTGAELAITADGRYLYANETFSPNNIIVFDVQTDSITPLYQSSITVSASRFSILPDGSKVFTSGAQVWSGNMQEQLGTLEGGAGQLIKFIAGRNVVALTASGTNGDVIRFLSPANYRLLSVYDPPGNGTMTEMEAAPDGSKLLLNSNNTIQLLSLDPALPMSITAQNGSGQSVQISTPFESPLKAKLQNLYGNPLPNVVVNFQAPSAGASALFADTNSNTTSAVTDANGVATSSILSANNLAGSYAIQATVPNLNTSLSFQLTNLASITCSIRNGTEAPSLFEPYKQYNCGKSGYGVGTGDFNNDDRKDVALSVSSGTGVQSVLLVFTQDNDGNLTQPHVYTGGNRAESLAVGDLNYDGLDDVVTADFSDNKISVFLQKSSGGFASRITYTTSTGPDAVAVGDVNHDGRLDVVISHWNSAVIGVFTQGQNGNLNAMTTYPSVTAGYDDIAIGDVNGDGLDDVVKMNGQLYANPHLQVYLQNANGVLGTAVPYWIGCSNCLSSGIDIGDVTGDGRADVVLTYGGNKPSSNIAVFAQSANGTLQPAISYPAYDIPEAVAIADLNLDTLMDVAIGHSGWQRTGVYLQNTNGTLNSELLYTLPNYYPEDLDIGDVNGDGLPDIVIADNLGLVVLYRNPNPPSTPTPGPGPSPTPRPSSTPGPSPTPAPPSSTGNRRTYTAAGSGSLPGYFLCDQNQSTCTNGADLDADAAHKYAADTFVFYNTHHGRNSFDGSGSTMISTVHYGISYRNAFWDGYQVVYGDRMAADDVVGHEITHGVTEYTSNLIYAYQSGAINESFSDLWGEFIDQTNNSGNDSASVKWLLGEDSALGVIRSMSNPPAYEQPDKMSSPYYYTGSGDNGGVHINSGVNNKAAYLLVAGGTFNGKTVMSIGLDKTAAIYYEAQVHQLTMGANYNDLYYALLQACQDLIGGADGITQNNCEQVQAAAEAVEMTQGSDIPTEVPTAIYTWYPSTSTPTATWPPTFVFTPSRTNTPTRTSTPTRTPTATQPASEVAIQAWIAAEQQGNHLISRGQALQIQYPGVNNGPVKLMSNASDAFVGSEAVTYAPRGTPLSFSEMMGIPDHQLDTTYWLPWYNNVDLDTQLRFGNISGSTATIQVFIGGLEVTGSPFTLLPGQSARKSFAGINQGPVRVESNVPIVVAERVIYKVKGMNTSFSEMMALPNSQLDTTYWLPWYNNVDLDTQLRIANLSSQTATVSVYIGGREMIGGPILLGPGASIRKSFAGVNNGPVKIVSNQRIVAAERVIYKVNNIATSFSEMMALPNSQLDTTYWFPWYDNVHLDAQLRLGNLSNTQATVHIYMGGVEMAGSPFSLAPGASIRQSFSGVNNGPVKIISDQTLVAALRVIQKENSTPTSFSEMMGLPDHLLDTIYWFPWYNNIDLNTQLHLGIP